MVLDRVSFAVPENGAPASSPLLPVIIPCFAGEGSYRRCSIFFKP